MKNKTGPEILAAYTRAHTLFSSRGLRPQLQRLNNEASAALKVFMTEQEVDFQLVPPHYNKIELIIGLTPSMPFRQKPGEYPATAQPYFRRRRLVANVPLMIPLCYDLPYRKKVVIDGCCRVKLVYRALARCMYRIHRRLEAVFFRRIVSIDRSQ